jgi:tetratricopeptide (TPR) repeat protein
MTSRRGSVAAAPLSISTRELSQAFSASKKTAYDEAETTLREAYEHLVKENGAFDAHSLAMLHTYAELVKIHDLREGSELLEECQRGCIITYGAEHAISLGIMTSLADTYAEMGRAENALWLYRAVYSHRCARNGAEHPETLNCSDKLAAGYVKIGNYGRAEELHLAHLTLLETQLGSEDPSTMDAVYLLADLYVQQGRYAEAEPLLKECLATYERVVGAQHPDYLRGLFILGCVVRSAHCVRIACVSVLPCMRLLAGLVSDHSS